MTKRFRNRALLRIDPSSDLDVEAAMDRAAASLSSSVSGLPLKWSPPPAPTKKPEKMAKREWSRYAQAKQPDPSEPWTKLLDDMAYPIGLKYFGRGTPKVRPSKTAPRRSKTALKKPKRSKPAPSAVNKLNLTRVASVDDDEV